MTASKQPELPVLTQSDLNETQRFVDALDLKRRIPERKAMLLRRSIAWARRCLSAERELGELNDAQDAELSEAQDIRGAIDEALGWDSEEQAEAGNYAGRIRDVAERWKAAEDAIDAERSLAEQATQDLMKAERSLSEVKAERDELKAELADAKAAFTARSVADSQLCGDCELLIAAGKVDAVLFRLRRFGYEPSLQSVPAGDACPKCGTGIAIEGTPGYWCSRRYETDDPCDWESP